jgi:hypothetical protein
MSDRNHGGVPVQMIPVFCKQFLCKEIGVVVNPVQMNTSGIDLDVDWLDRCDCPTGKCKGNSKGEYV